MASDRPVHQPTDNIGQFLRFLHVLHRPMRAAVFAVPTSFRRVHRQLCVAGDAAGHLQTMHSPSPTRRVLEACSSTQR